MASEVGFRSPARNDSTVVTPWPTSFDTKDDIFVINKPDSFRQQLRAALRTRGMLHHIEEQELTYDALYAANPMANEQQLQDTLSATQQERQRQLELAAANLPRMLKADNMNHSEIEEINRLAQ